ncbi:MAG: DUF2232 domain-containing protein [Clostridia bacterium]|nr:DUF2232 domain-containing protein [Clostridia bacterium]
MGNQLPLVRSGKACVTGALLVSLPFLFFMLPGQRILGPLPAVYATLLILYLLPTALCMVTMVCGLAAAAAGLAAAMACMAMLTGSQGLMLALLYIVPVFAAFLIVIHFEIPFWKSLLAMISVHAVSLTAVFLLARAIAGGDLYNGAGEAVANFLENWDMGDLMLYQMYSMGLIDLKSDLADSALRQVLGGYQLSSAARADMLLSVRSLITDMLRSMVPHLIVNQSVTGGTACLLLALRFGFLAEEKREFLRNDAFIEEAEGEKKHPVHFPDLGMPPLSQWHIPRGVGWQVGVALAAGYLLRASGTPALNTAGILLYGAASAVFSIQGLAAVNFFQKKRGSSRFWRVLVPLLLMTTGIPVVIGVFDQINNFRGLRKPPEPKEDFL